MANPLLGLDGNDPFQRLTGNPLFAAQEPGGVAGSLFREGKSLADATPEQARNWGHEVAKTPVGGGPTQGQAPGNQPLSEDEFKRVLGKYGGDRPEQMRNISRGNIPPPVGTPYLREMYLGNEGGPIETDQYTPRLRGHVDPWDEVHSRFPQPVGGPVPSNYTLPRQGYHSPGPALPNVGPMRMQPILDELGRTLDPRNSFARPPVRRR
jgi:hypothetical protein